MKLTTKAIIAEFEKYPFHSQEKLGGDAHVICAFRLPSQTWVYLVLEAEPLTLDKYDAYAQKLKAGDTWGLRGIVFDEEHPHGQYALFVLAEIEQRKKFTAIRNAETGEEEYVEEQAERIKDFVPCSVAEVMEGMDMADMTADNFCMDMLAAVKPAVRMGQALREIAQMDTDE